MRVEFTHMRHILVAEDDDAIRRSLQDALEGAGYAVETAADGEAALAVLLSRPVDLALLDVNMPVVSGFKLLKIMARECPGIPSIILTARGEEQDRVKGLELGADDYVVKPFSVAELLARIAAVLRRYPGKPHVAAAELAFPGGRLNGEAQTAEMDDGSATTLTEREFALFRYFLSHPDRTISQEELLLRVWGIQGQAEKTRTVAVTLARLKEKIGPAAAERFENVRGRGYKWNTQP